MTGTASTAPFGPSHTGLSLSTIAKSEGSLDGKIVVKEYRPLLIALAILGVLSLAVVAGTGFASLGNHQTWWSAPGLSQLSKMDAIIMISSGGGAGLLLIIGSIIGLKAVKSEMTELDAENKLVERSFTWYLQKDGRWTFMVKQDGKIVTTRDITDEKQCQSLEELYPSESGYTFIPTSPTTPLPQQLEFSEKSLTERLNLDNSFTFVQQRDGNYALGIRESIEQGLDIHYGYDPEAMHAEIDHYKKSEKMQFVKTSELPPKG